MFTLHNGDCLQVMPSIPSGSIDAIITDLPYGTTACAWDEVIPFADMWKEVKRVLKPAGVFITTSSQPFTSTLICSNIKSFNCEWILDKGYCTGHLTAKYKPMKQHETIVVFCDNPPCTYNPQMETLRGNDARFRKNGRKNGYKPDDIYSSNLQSTHHNDTGERYPKSIIRKLQHGHETKHPTQKSVDLYRYLIRTYTNEGETVLDIAMGSGTTIEAAIIEGRYSIGIEKDTEFGYFQIAENRAKSAVLQQRLFTPSNNRLHMDAGDSPRLPSQSTLEGFTPAE